ncbi:hypothetical protein ORV05_17740 [Amycolatopsis cynarae]|uniref:PH domain-containing protein n=1 Tax=Amycolatopsis cynarae TaxID=2995223 RepID=A0ABY7BB19_9PSEU|nr:hypothetical protein [Amycolatopsis sp. HUAS 11-8]WAL69535.1 hypothetical protein ORV05_17740 [Amycolatopsis sp. HUAS 11-8]
MEDTGDPARTWPPDEQAALLAERHGYGSPVVTPVLARFDNGCLAVFAPLVLGLVAAAVFSFGRGALPAVVAGFAVIGLALCSSFWFWRRNGKVRETAPRMYCFERGFVLAGAGRLRPYAWTEIDATKRTTSTRVGQADHLVRRTHLDIRTKDGELLVSLGELDHQDQVAHLAGLSG